MFFESRINVPECSDEYTTARKLFLSGRVRDSRVEAERLRRLTGPICPADGLLCSDISRASDFVGEHFATIRILRRRFPDDPWVRVEWIRSLASRGRALAAIRTAEAELESAETADPARSLLIRALLAATQADVGLAEDATRHVATILKSDSDDPKVWYELAWTSERLRDWRSALEYGQRAHELAPDWPRAAMIYGEALFATGKTDEAMSAISSVLDNGIEDATLELIRGLQEFHGGDHGAAFTTLFNYEYQWKRTRLGRSVKDAFRSLPWEIEDASRYLEMLLEVDPELHGEISAHFGRTNHRIISIPAIRQERFLCVPTTVTMVCAAQGVSLDPTELYEAMLGRQGTLLWKMREVMEARGYRVEVIRAEPELIRRMIVQGVPLIGSIEYLFSGHVEVICGYDEDRDYYYLRDPESWSTGWIEGKHFADRYELFGNGVFAIVPPARRDEVEILDEWKAPVASALLDLERHRALCDREAADRAYAAIPQDHPAWPRAVRVAANFSVTPGVVSRAIEEMARSGTVNRTSRFQALLSISSLPLLDQAIEEAESGEERAALKSVRPLIRVHQLSTKGEWKELLKLADEVLEHSPGLEALWIYRAESLVQMDRFMEAMESAHRALQVAPDSEWIRRRVRTLFPDLWPRDLEMQELESLIERFPFSHELGQEKARLLYVDGDGLAYEAAEQTCQRAMPRSPESYVRLAHWYSNQGNLDLARSVLRRGRDLIGEDELPFWEFETGGNSPATVEAPDVDAADASDATDGVDAAGAEVTALEQVDSSNLLAAVRFDLASHQNGPCLSPRELQELERREAAQSLEWSESAELLALRVRLALRTPGDAAIEAVIDETLPDSLPGPKTAYLRVFLDCCQPASLPRRANAHLLSWVDGHDFEGFQDADLRFEIAFLVESTGDLERAKTMYRQISEGSPGNVGSLFRLGVVLQVQGYYKESLAIFERALQSSPGMMSCLDAKLWFLERSGDEESVLQSRVERCGVLPYSFEEFDSLIGLEFELHGLKSALERLHSSRDHFSEDVIMNLEAQLHARSGEFDKALEILDAHPGTSPKGLIVARVTRLLCALHDGDEEKIAQILATCLKEMPDNTWVQSRHGERLQQYNPVAAEEFYKSLLLEGRGGPGAALTLLRLPEVDARAVVESLKQAVGEDHRNDLAVNLHVALDDLGDLYALVQFLEWCHENTPELDYLEEARARFWILYGRPGEGARIATELQAKDPEDPRWKELVASCQVTADAKGSVRIMEGVVARTGTVTSLAQLGQCYLLAGEMGSARTVLSEVLERDPANVPALAGLLHMGMGPRPLWDGICAAVEARQNTYHPWFLVAVVEAARTLGKTPPEEWYECARFWFFTLSQVEGAKKEKVKLGLALIKWVEARDPAAAEISNWIRGELPWWQTVWVGLSWPGTDWIPER